MTHKTYSHFLIIGTGGIGGLYGSILHSNGIDVTIAANRDFTSVSQTGITVSSPHGPFHFPSSNIIQIGSPAPKPVDVIILTTKVLPSIDFQAIITPYLSPTTTLVCLQNGINIEQHYLDIFPNISLISGVAFVCSTRVSPGQILHQDHGQIVVGKYPTGSLSQSNPIIDAFKNTCVQISPHPFIDYIRWKKLVWNIAFNGLSVVENGASTYELTHNPHLIERARKLMEETVTIAHAKGIKLSQTIVSDTLSMTQSIPPYKTSMLVDFENNRPMEVEAIYGNTLKIAKQFDLSSPNIQTVYDALNERNHSI